MSRYYNDYLQHSDEDTLTHFGIPGMKWGVRKVNPLGATHLLLRNKIEEDTKYQDNIYVNM